ncbi:DUF2786 domain-containing protein [Streptomyces sp. NPDC059076]|uniref:DUF2786 domain-containing protein n=1 Tax=unclassified Streptomyces TaxID=2593676 RepID=UPI0036CD995A
MTDDGEHSPEKSFRWWREEWLDVRAREIAGVLESAGGGLHCLLPTDLGDRHLVAAVTIARVAADEARVRSPADTVGWLEHLIPDGHRHNLAGAVQEVRSRVASSAESALWAWNAEGWEELLLRWWRGHMPGSGDMRRDVVDWRSRWSAPIPEPGDRDFPEAAPHRHGRTLVTLADFFADEPEPLRLLARAVLDTPGTSAAVQDVVLLRKEHLQNAGHLEWLAEQQASAEQLEIWVQRHEQESESTRAFLEDLSEAAERYLSTVLQPVVDALSPCERALLLDSEDGPQRSAADYLNAFLDWQAQPDEYETAFGSPNTTMEQRAKERIARSELTWHGMVGSVPVWCHVVTSPQERAAALAYSGVPSKSVVNVVAESGGRQEILSIQQSLFEVLEEQDEWYPEPGIEIRYNDESVVGLCELLAVCRLGHALLEFLTVRADGSVQRLRSVRAHVRDADAVAWRRWALNSLSSLVPEPDDLADAIAEQEEDDFQADPDPDDLFEPDAPTRSEERTTSVPPTPSRPDPRAEDDKLPAALLARVKALLRKAEDPAATEDEARTYLEKATGLMAKYGIEQAMLDNRSEPGTPVDRVIDLAPPYAGEARRLLSQIALQMRCRSVFPGGRNNRNRIHVFGYEADLRATEILFASLRLQMLQGADRADRLHRPEKEDSRAYKRSWMLGFIREVANRIGTVERRARADAERESGQVGASMDGQSVALVLADRSVVVGARVSARYPKLTDARPPTFKGTGYWQGVADGRRQAEIGDPAFTDHEEQA